MSGNEIISNSVNMLPTEDGQLRDDAQRLHQMGLVLEERDRELQVAFINHNALEEDRWELLADLVLRHTVKFVDELEGRAFDAFELHNYLATQLGEPELALATPEEFVPLFEIARDFYAGSTHGEWQQVLNEEDGTPWWRFVSLQEVELELDSPEEISPTAEKQDDDQADELPAPADPAKSTDVPAAKPKLTVNQRGRRAIAPTQEKPTAPPAPTPSAPKAAAAPNPAKLAKIVAEKAQPAAPTPAQEEVVLAPAAVAPAEVAKPKTIDDIITACIPPEGITWNRLIEKIKQDYPEIDSRVVDAVIGSAMGALLTRKRQGTDTLIIINPKKTNKQ